MTMTASRSNTDPNAQNPPPLQPHPPTRNIQDSQPTVASPKGNAQEIRLILKITAANDTTVNIAALHRRCVEIMMIADPSMHVLTDRKEFPIITDIKDFPTNDAYLSAFKIIQKRLNKISLAFTVRTTATFTIIKRNSNLLEHLKQHNMSLQTSLTGSDNEISIGALLGINPEKTSRDNLRLDVFHRLHSVNQNTIDPDIIQQAKEKQPFVDLIPPFQLETRKIHKQHDNVNFDTKAFHIICDSAHSQLLSTIFQLGTESELLTGIGKFLSFKTNHVSSCKAIKWHNEVITGTRAFQIVDFPADILDHPINEHSGSTWRQKLIQDGKLVNMYQSKENNRFIATTHDMEHSMTYFTSIFRPLFESVFRNKILPSASPIIKPVKTPTQPPTPKAWTFLEDDASLLTEPTAFPTDRSTPNSTVQFVYSIDFPTLPTNPRASHPYPILPTDTASKSNDTLTTITHEDLDSLRTQIRQEIQAEIANLREETKTQRIIQTTTQEQQTQQMNDLLNAHQENNARLQGLVHAFHSFQTTIFQTLGIPSEKETMPSETRERKRETVSTPVHKNNSSDDDNSPGSSIFLTPSSRSSTVPKRHKGFNANRLYYAQDENPSKNLTDNFDEAMDDLHSNHSTDLAERDGRSGP